VHNQDESKRRRRGGDGEEEGEEERRDLHYVFDNANLLGLSEAMTAANRLLLHRGCIE